MPLTNLRSVHLTPAELTIIAEAMTVLKTALQNVNVELTAEDRIKYGSVNEQNKLLVNKVKDFRTNKPELSAMNIDWEEFEKDYGSRGIFENLEEEFQSLAIKVKNAKILHDYDNYQAALEDYSYTAYRAGSGADGFENKMNELKQFFNRSGQKAAPKKPIGE